MARGAAVAEQLRMAEAALVRCAKCGATNRVPRAKVAQGLSPKCGRCHAPLPIADEGPVVVTDGNFADVVERSPLPVLLDAWAAWCAPATTSQTIAT